MDLYPTLYKTMHHIFHPINRRMQLNRALVRGLGKGRPRRIGRALVSYLSDYVRFISEQATPSVWDREDLDTVLDGAIQGKFASHYQHWESSELVRQLIERGFIVDCIYDRNGYLIEDASSYDLILDEWSNLPRWAEQNPSAKKWSYVVISHWLFWNSAELQRLNWLFKRRGAALPPQRQLPPLLGPECADLVSYVGNDFILGTYGVLGSKMRRIQLCPAVTSQGLKPKDWSSAKKRFLFFGSTGWVHRGLDLVLEAFMQTDLELLICGADQGFSEVYGEELKRHKNIQYLGFVYPDSTAFQQIVANTCAVVYPSAAEGCSTSILQCMHFGLIPIVSRAAGQGVHHFWPALDGDTDQALIENILQRCSVLSEYSDHQLEELSHSFWEYANQNHTRQAYRASLSGVLDELLGK